MEDNKKAVGIFNVGEEDIRLNLNWKDIGLKTSTKVMDAWRHSVFEQMDSITYRIGKHDVLLMSI